MLFAEMLAGRNFCACRHKTLMGLPFSLAAILLAHERFPPRGMNSKSPVVLQWLARKNENTPPPHLICNALVPNTLARSYFVIYGVVLRFSFEIFLSLNPCTAFFFPPPVAFWPPASAPSPTGTIVWPFASPSPWPDSMCRARSRLSVPSGFSTSSGSWGSKTGSSSSKVASAGS